MSTGLSEFWLAKHTGGWLAVSVCALGRAADFATTWVALKEGRAMEAKTGVAQLLAAIGTYKGLIAYEALITTPAIFLGCQLVRRSCSPRPTDGLNAQAPGHAERMFFFSIGVISLIAAVHNTRFLFGS
jgi:hypothetical protein